MTIQRIAVALLLAAWASSPVLGDEPAALSKSKTVRLLAVGNSFTKNATHYLDGLAKGGGHTLVLRQVTLGNASLAKHMELAKQAEKTPQADGETLPQLLAAENFDFVTIQQYSLTSHNIDTYRPYARQLYDFINQHSPKSQVLVLQTWAYRVDDPRFSNPAPAPGEPATQKAMYEGLTKAYETIAAELGCRLIPIGDAFYRADTDPKWGYKHDAAFDYKNSQGPAIPDQAHTLHSGWRWGTAKDGTKTLGMDGHHASNAGEYLAGCVFYEVLFGDSVVGNTYAPKGLDAAYVRFLQETAHKAVADRASRVAPK